MGNSTKTARANERERDRMADNDLQQQRMGYRLTTAEILYRMPDHPGLLQSFVWQQLDRAPDFPGLTRFLDYWRCNLDAELHSVRVGSAELFRAPEIRTAQAEFRLH